MLLKVFGVAQIIIQVISAQISVSKLVSHNVLKDLANTPLAGYGRFRRQINTPPASQPGNGLTNGATLGNGMPFGNFPRGNGLPNNFALNNGLPNNSPISPLNFPCTNMDALPQNSLLPNINGINNNRVPFNNNPNVLLGFNNVPNGLPGLNNVPNGLPGLNNMLNGLPGLNNVSNGLPGINNAANRLPGLNNVPNGLPGLDTIPNGLPGINYAANRLPGLNNVLNGLPGLNNVPNGLPGINNAANRLPGLNNVPNGLPGLDTIPNGLPGINYAANRLPGLNNVPNGLPGLDTIPNGLPGINNAANRLPGLNNVPNGLPSFDNVPTELPNLNNLPMTNKFQNLINVPAGNNILNLNNLPAAHTIPNPTGLPNFNNLPFGGAVPSLPVSNRLPLNNLPNGNMLPSMSNKLPFLNNFRITEIGIGHGVADINRFPRNSKPDGNVPTKVNYSQNGNELARQVSDGLPVIKIYQKINGFTDMTNTPSASALPSFVPVDNGFSNVNYFPMNNGVISEAQNTLLNNGMPDINNFQNYNVVPVNEQSFVNNAFAVAKIFPANTIISNANNRLVNAINNGMPLSNGGNLNDILLDNSQTVNVPETYVQYSGDNGFTDNDIQFGNVQVPDKKWHYEFVETNMPGSHSSLPEGVQAFTNMPNDYQTSSVSNTLNLAQELVKNLKIEGLGNMPFLNGLPVAGITETVTLLNGPYGK